MYSVGDIVRINPMYPEDCMEGGYAKVLKGTIARITTKTERPSFYRNSKYVYNLKFLEIHSSNPSPLDIIAETLNWRDEHIELVEKERKVQDFDTSILFTES